MIGHKHDWEIQRVCETCGESHDASDLVEALRALLEVAADEYGDPDDDHATGAGTMGRAHQAMLSAQAALAKVAP